MLIYRDPELSRLFGEIEDLKLKNIALEEQNAQLRNLLKTELSKFPDAVPRTPGIKCKWFGMHKYVFLVDAGLWKIEQNYLFGRQELFRWCRIECSSCGFRLKETNESWAGCSFGTLIKVANLFEIFFENFRDEHPEFIFPNATPPPPPPPV